MTRFKDAELAALEHSSEAARSATHHRALHGYYSYEQILGLNLVERCLAVLGRSRDVVRVLDIGCGDGWALHQLRQELRRHRLEWRFELYGLGLNRYPTMYIAPDRFIRSGINQLVHAGPLFDLIFSVFTFHYVPHKIEAVEMIHNHLLAPNGEAHLHFPGYLVRIDDAPQMDPEAGNARFVEALASSSVRKSAPQVRFRIVPHYSDDEDGADLGSFGVLRMTKTDAWVDFGLLYADCELVSPSSSSVYVATKYMRTQTLHERASFDKLTITRRLTQATEHIKDYTFDVTLDLCVHRERSPHVIINYPGASRTVDGFEGRYKSVAAEIQSRHLSAVVRASNPFIRSVDYPEMLIGNLRCIIDYVLEHAEEICGTADPDLYLMGHSAGASAAAALATEYPQIKKLLLMAPSLDAGKEAIRAGLRDYTGELRIVVGMDDHIVLPVHSRFYHYVARRAAEKRFVALWHCDHDFSGPRNYDLLRKAPLWAYFGDPDFPDAGDPIDPEELIYR